MTDSLSFARDALLTMLLVASVITDLRERRILNAFTYPALLTGLLLAGMQGLRGLGAAAGGAALAAVVLWPLCRSGGMGWGDLKLAAAAGALTGARVAASSLVNGALLGGVAAVVIVAWRGELLATVRRSLAVPRGVVRSLRSGARPAFHGARGPTIPYGVAIAAGTAIARWARWPW